MRMDLCSVLRKIKPSEKEEAEMREFGAKLVSVASRLSGAKPMLCGSVEKGTWLTEKSEIDLFLLFDPSTPRKQLETKGLAMAKNIIKSMNGTYVIAYAEHPYLRGRVKNHDVDIVPCFDIKDPEKIQSAVDRTPHHVKFVKANLKDTDQVRLLKQFCRANRCYGADLKTQGFSGYICELLIIKYGSFEELAKHSSKWRAGHSESFGADASRFRSPLVFVDPVDSNRNVGAALSAESFYRFVKACNEFVKNPRQELFFRKETKPYSKADVSKEIERRGTRWYAISFDAPNVIEDVLYPQMRKCVASIGKMLGQNGFEVLRSDFYCDDICIITFEMKEWQVPKIAKNIGPDIYSRHADQFLKHYKDKRVFIEGENWVVETEREFTSADQMLKSMLKNSKKKLLEIGIPSRIAPAIKESKMISSDIFVASLSRMPVGYRAFLREWFEKDMNVI